MGERKGDDVLFEEEDLPAGTEFRNGFTEHAGSSRSDRYKSSPAQGAFGRAAVQGQRSRWKPNRDLGDRRLESGRYVRGAL